MKNKETVKAIAKIYQEQIVPFIMDTASNPQILSGCEITQYIHNIPLILTIRTGEMEHSKNVH